MSCDGPRVISVFTSGRFDRKREKNTAPKMIAHTATTANTTGHTRRRRFFGGGGGGGALWPPSATRPTRVRVLFPFVLSLAFLAMTRF